MTLFLAYVITVLFIYAYLSGWFERSFWITPDPYEEERAERRARWMEGKEIDPDIQKILDGNTRE